jgi:hypothetical protein
MSRRSKQRKPKGFYGNNYWQSADFNQRLYNGFRTQILNIAMARFKWINLPATCDERFLEWTLLTQGVATIAHPRRGSRRDCFYSTQAIVQDFPNVYDNPTKWDSFGNNGWRFGVDSSNGVLIWDNLNRLPVLDMLELYARELTDIMRTKQLNRQHQKIPFIITGSQDQKLDMLNLYKMVDGGEPAILATNAMSTIDFKALKTDVPFLGNELQEEILNVWNNIYTLLGIDNMPFKAERQIQDEVNSAMEPCELMALSPLTARREACRKLNERFEQFIKKPIDVVWRRDNASDNYNFANNSVERAKMCEGDYDDN